MIGWGVHFQVSGLGRQVPGSGVQVRVKVQEICPLSSIQSSSRVAGIIHSALHSVLNAVLHSALHPSTQSSVIDSAIVAFRVAGGSPGCLAAGHIHSALPFCPCHRLSPPSSIQPSSYPHPYPHPYPLFLPPFPLELSRPLDI